MGHWLERLRAGLRWRPPFEVWVASAGGRLLFMEACGLTRRAALEFAQAHLQRRPLVPVLVVDGDGAAVYPLRRRGRRGVDPAGAPHPRCGLPLSRCRANSR